MKCKRCDIQFSATSVMVTDHKYVQECIDALKGRVRELEKQPPTIVPMSGSVTSTQLEPVTFTVYTTAGSGNIVGYGLGAP